MIIESQPWLNRLFVVYFYRVETLYTFFFRARLKLPFQAHADNIAIYFRVERNVRSPIRLGLSSGTLITRRYIV